MHLCLMVSNCTAMWSFSKLRRIKNYLLSSTWQEKLSMLSLMSMEILGDTDLGDNHQQFRVQTIRRRETFRSCLFSKKHTLTKW